MTAREFFRAAKKHRPQIEEFVLDILDKSKLVKITKKEEIVKVERPELAPYIALKDAEGSDIKYDTAAIQTLLDTIASNATDADAIQVATDEKDAEILELRLDIEKIKEATTLEDVQKVLSKTDEA